MESYFEVQQKSSTLCLGGPGNASGGSGRARGGASYGRRAVAAAKGASMQISVHRGGEGVKVFLRSHTPGYPNGIAPPPEVTRDADPEHQSESHNQAPSFLSLYDSSFSSYICKSSIRALSSVYCAGLRLPPPYCWGEPGVFAAMSQRATFVFALICILRSEHPIASGAVAPAHPLAVERNAFVIARLVRQRICDRGTPRSHRLIHSAPGTVG